MLDDLTANPRSDLLVQRTPISRVNHNEHDNNDDIGISAMVDLVVRVLVSALHLNAARC